MQPKSRFGQSGNRRSTPSSRRHVRHARPIIEQLEGRELFSGTAVATVPAPLRANPNALTIQNPGPEAAPKPVSTGTISGTVYNDTNLDGVRESGEAGLVGWQVYADLGNHGVYTHGDPVGITNAAGQYTIGGLKPGTYRVREVPQNGWSRTQPAGLYPLGDYDITLVAGQVRSGANFGDALPAPANVVASTTQTKGILVTWSASVGTGATYQVYRDSLKSPIATNIASTSFLDKAATRGAKHTYWVVAVIAGQRSSVSAPATGVALNVVTVAAPQNVTASTTKTDGILVTWSASSGTGVTYEVYRDSLSSPVATNITSPSFLDAGATPGTTHTYWVVAVISGQSSPASASAAGMALAIAAPGDVKASTTQTDGILVTWSASSGTGVTYDVNRDSLSSPLATNITSTSFLDTEATPGTVHTYWVVAVIAGQSSPASASATGMDLTIAAPENVTASTTQADGILVTWSESSGTGVTYDVYRDSLSSPLATDITSTSFLDTQATPGTTHTYWVVAVIDRQSSRASAPATGTDLAIAAPEDVTASTTQADGILVTWSASSGTGVTYDVYRDSLSSPLATDITSTSFLDTGATPGTSHTYWVVAVIDGQSSPASTPTTGTVFTIAAPENVTASTTETDSILVTWSESSGTGVTYDVYRDSLNSPLATDITSTSFLDTGATPGTSHTYWVVAVIDGQSSPASAPGTGMVFATVSVTTRYGDELVVTASGPNDDVSISQSRTTISIVADQDTYVEPAPAAGVFVYTRGGDDTVSVDRSVTVATTVETIDNSPDTIISGSSSVIAWIDATDSFTGAGTVHSVSSFAGGVSKAAGASLPDPTDAGVTEKVNLSLFGTGPVPADVNQGEAGDCYFMASLAAIALHSPQTLENSAVDMGDGTYVVQFYSQSAGDDVFVRVNNDFSTGYFGGFNYAHPGANNTDWAMVMEKAFCYFLTGANTYASIWAGCWMSAVYAEFGIVNSTSFPPSDVSESDFYSQVSAALSAGLPVTFATNFGNPDLVGDHAYTVISASKDASGSTIYEIRNPWGSSGDALENSLGYATVNFSQIAADAYDVCIGL